MTIRIDATWYRKPEGIRERLTAGGIVVRRAADAILVALVEEISLDGYVLPKGGVDPGEDLEIAARREIEEESGLSELTKLADLAVLERLESMRRFWSIIHYGLFLTHQESGVILDAAHHPAMAWFPLFELPKMFWPDEKALIENHRSLIVECVSKAFYGF